MFRKKTEFELERETNLRKLHEDYTEKFHRLDEAVSAKCDQDWDLYRDVLCATRELKSEIEYAATHLNTFQLDENDIFTKLNSMLTNILTQSRQV